MRETIDFKRGWLRAFWDGEGGVYWYDYGNRHHSQRLTVSTTSLALRNIACRYLKDLGIGWRIRRVAPRKHHWKVAWVIDVQRAQDLTQFAKLVGFGDSKKSAILKKVVVYVNRSGRLVRERLLPEKAKHLYDSGYSYRWIAKRYGFKSGDSIRLFIFENFPTHASRSHRENVEFFIRNRYGQLVSRRACTRQHPTSMRP